MACLQVFSTRLPNGSASNTEYLGIIGAGYTTAAVPSLCLWNVSWRAFTFEHVTAPGAGKSFTYTLVKNGVDTSTVIVIADSDTVGRSVVPVAGVDGDEFYWRRNPSGTPTVSHVRYTVEMAHTTNFVSGYCTRGAVSTSSTFRSPVFAPTDSAGWSVTAGANQSGIVAVAGDLTRLAYQLFVAPGTGASYTIGFYLNGVAQDGTGGTPDLRVTIADLATYGEWTGSLTLAPGDRVHRECTPSSSPAPTGTNLSSAETFLADVDGESHCCGTTQSAMPTSGTSYNAPHQRQSGDFGYKANDGLSDVNGSVSSFLLRSLRVRTSNTITTGPVTFTTRRDGTSPSGTPSVTLTSGTQSGHDATGEITIADGETWSLEYVATGTPGVSRVATWSWAMFALASSPKVGCFVAGVTTTVKATRAAAFGLDGATNVHDEAGKLKVFGDFEVTGTARFGVLDATLEALSNVALGSPVVAGEVLTYDGAEWVNADQALGALADVALGSPVVDGEHLVYDGSDWVNTLPILREAEIAISSAELLALRATPKTIVAAPGSGRMLEFVALVLLLDATATAYVETAANLAVKYTDGSGVQVSETIEATGFIDQTTDTMTTGRPKLDAIVAKAGCENQALVLHNLGAGEYTTGTGVIRAKVAYRVWETGW